MIRIPEIGISALECFDACIANTRADRKAEFLLARPQLEAAETVYRRNALGCVVSSQPRAIGGLVTLTESDFGNLYEDKLRNKNVPAARSIYDRLRAHGASRGPCPYCGTNPVKTLDHFLPKSQWPLLAVAPCNLIPCCSDCNTGKLAVLSINAEEVPLHPYFEEIKGPWLVANIEPNTSGLLRFEVMAAIARCPLQGARITAHFTTFGLGELYGHHAVQLLESSRFQFNSLRAKVGPSELRAHLRDMAGSAHLARPNGWRSVAFAAWAGSETFCQGGVGP